MKSNGKCQRRERGGRKQPTWDGEGEEEGGNEEEERRKTVLF